MVQISMIRFKTRSVSNERAACVNVVLHGFNLKQLPKRHSDNCKTIPPLSAFFTNVHRKNNKRTIVQIINQVGCL